MHSAWPRGRLGLAGAALLVLSLVTLTAPTASADAKPRWERKERSLRMALEMPARNGYQMQLLTAGHRQVMLLLSKGEVLVAYKTLGQVSRHGIEADFGELGKISVRFDGHLLPRFFGAGMEPPGWLLPPPKCRGRKPQRLLGRFHGSIEFEGERGFSGVDAKSARGELVRTYRRLCEPLADSFFGLALASLAERVREQEPRARRSLLDSVRFNTVTASSHAGGRQVYIVATEVETSDRRLRRLERVLAPFVVGGSREEREGVLIERVAVVEGKKRSMVVSPPKKAPATARLAFPKPLEGVGMLTQTAKVVPTWTGSLAIRLPGLGAAPLTGPGAEAILCRTALLNFLRTPCERRALSLVPKHSVGAFFVG